MATVPRAAPQGDTAVMTYWGREADAHAYARWLTSRQLDWVEDIVIAYASVGIFVNTRRIDFSQAFLWISKHLRLEPLGKTTSARPAKNHIIPCCYERQLDLNRVASATGLSPDAVIQLHTSQLYTVFAVGFSPGFPYLGYLPQALTGVPRLDSPRLRLEPGSVGLTGKQTGVYPLERPGGWNIIGRTPLVLVDVEDRFFPIAVGDSVQFQRIDEGEFQRLNGERLKTE